jgi:flagellar biosynthesis component FlhA
MDSNKGKQEISVLGRLFSMEALILVMGIASLVSGLVSGNTMQIFWGVSIICGAVALHFVRKKDWKKHWEEEEQLRDMRQLKEQERKERERNDTGKP